MKKIVCLSIAFLAVAVGLQSSAGATTTPSILYGPLLQEDGVVSSFVVLTNREATASTADIRYYNSDGTLAATEPVTLASQVELIVPAVTNSSLWAGTLAAVEVEVTSGPNLAGTVVRISPEFAVSEAMGSTISRDLYSPNVQGDGVSFNSSIALQNPSATSLNATVSFYNPDGTLATTDTVTIAAHGSALLLSSTYFPSFSQPFSNVEVAVTDGTATDGLVGVVFRGDANRFQSDAFLTETAATHYAPFVQEGFDFNTFLILQNPNATASSGTVEFHNLDGTLANSTPFALAAHGSTLVATSGFVSGWAANVANAEVTVTSGPGIVTVNTIYHPEAALGHPALTTAETQLIGLAMQADAAIDSLLALQNPDDVDSVSALVTFINPDGTVADTTNVTVPANGTGLITGSTVNALWATSTATVDVTVTAGPGLVGTMSRFNAGLLEFMMSEILVPPPAQGGGTPPPVDTDGDGVFDDVDVCPNMFGRPEWDGAPSAIWVKAKKHKVWSTTTFPTVEDQILNGLNVYLFNIDAGSILEDDDEEDWSKGSVLGWSLRHKDYQSILDNAIPEGVKQIGENGWVLFGACPGKYLLIGEQADGTLVGKKVGHLRDGKLKRKKIKMLLVNNKKRPGRCRRRRGSDMWIVEPASVDWTDPVEYFPFVFDTEGTWNAAVDVFPPAGFVPDYDALTGDVTDTQRCFQFEIVDVGSEWTDTDVVMTLDHLAATEVLIDQIDMVNSLIP